MFFSLSKSNSDEIARHDERLKALEKNSTGLNERNHALSGKIQKHESKILFTQKSLDDLKELINKHIKDVSKDFEQIRLSLSEIKTLKNKILWGVFFIMATSQAVDKGVFDLLLNFFQNIHIL